MTANELAPEQLRRRCPPEQLDFETTAELSDLEDLLGQPRARAALDFGVGIAHHGYNLFALGPDGVGKRSAVHRFLEESAASRPAPSDWCYVNNFEEPHRPRCLELPAGRGRELASAMSELAEDLRAALEAAFESDEYKTRRQVIEDELSARPERAFSELRAHAEAKGFILLRTPMGVVFAPKRDGEVIPPEEFQKIPEEERKVLEAEMKQLQAEFQQLVQKAAEWERDRQQQVRELNREVTRGAATSLIGELRARFSSLAPVTEYLEAVEKDVVEHAGALLGEQSAASEEPTDVPVPAALTGKGLLARYQVNVLVDNARTRGAPVVFEDNPTYGNLVGRVEHVSQMGALLTDFRLIRPGALHAANGGYLVLQARQLLGQPLAYEGLKRALRNREVRIESLGQALSLVTTISLEPETIPLDVKVVLLGDRRLYYLLAELDPELSELFKVQVDFDDETAWTPEVLADYARMLATAARREKLHPLGKDAVARIIEESARLVGDRERLSVHMARLVDLMREADHFAHNGDDDDSRVVRAEHVDRAIEARRFRADRVARRLEDEVVRDTILIDTEGARVGQINGLSVQRLGDLHFGRPTRITARVRFGRGHVVDIEREVELGGPLHSKGVLILSGFLGARFGAEQPLALSASLVFEQSYGGVDGDSASSAELYALLSAIGEIPLRQSLAVTGSVNQHGEVQAIGGVNEKIEGFFDVCARRGLTGRQGVLIPQANVKHLMLRADVVEAARDGRFHIYPIDHVDQGIELLTGLPAGQLDSLGTYPDGSVNAIVEARLAELTERMLALGKAVDAPPNRTGGY